MQKATVQSVNESGICRTVAFSLTGGAIGSIIVLILIVICSLFAVSREDPDKSVAVFGIAIPAIAYFTSGYISCRLSRRAPLICGIISFISMMILIKFYSFAFKTGVASAHGVPVKVALCIVYALLSVIGAIVAANLSQKAKKSGKRHIKSR